MPESTHPANLAQVTQPWKPTYLDPLVLRRGESVQLGKQDGDWPGWVWCINLFGKSGWVPWSYLDLPAPGASIARANRDYSTLELEVMPGERLALELTESGWGWVAHPDGRRGWVPLSCLEILPE